MLLLLEALVADHGSNAGMVGVTETNEVLANTIRELDFVHAVDGQLAWLFGGDEVEVVE